MKSKLIILVVWSLFYMTLSASFRKLDPELWKKALAIHDSAIVIDTHCDTPMAIKKILGGNLLRVFKQVEKMCAQ
jgi:hypothetical protein